MFRMSRPYVSDAMLAWDQSLAASFAVFTVCRLTERAQPQWPSILLTSIQLPDQRVSELVPRNCASLMNQSVTGIYCRESSQNWILAVLLLRHAAFFFLKALTSGPQSVLTVTGGASYTRLPGTLRVSEWWEGVRRGQAKWSLIVKNLFLVWFISEKRL